MCLFVKKCSRSQDDRASKTESAIDLSLISKNTFKIIDQWCISNESRKNEYKFLNNNKKLQEISDHYFQLSWINFDTLKIKKLNTHQLILMNTSMKNIIIF